MPSGPRAFFLGNIFVAVLFAATPSFASFHEKTLYSFCAEANCTDGNQPESALIRDAENRLYGTTLAGGANVVKNFGVGGTVFQLRKRRDHWTHKVLYSFCALESCADGSTPIGALIFDVAGNLYGTTAQGGLQNGGTVFELIRTNNHWQLRTLYSFSGADGNEPTGQLTYLGAANGTRYDGTSPLYGTTTLGGSSGQGIAFRLSKTAHGWREAVVRDLGSYPSGGVAMDAAGDLFVVTSQGGKNQVGSALELTERREHGKWAQHNLHSFDACCTSGYQPVGAIVVDGLGDLYGATLYGGAGRGGTIYKLSRSAKGGRLREDVLHSYCSEKDCRDGELPYAGVSLDGAGNVLSVATKGGHNGFGSVLKLSPKGKILGRYDFCSVSGCADGADPVASVFSDSSCVLFGVTKNGGAYADDEGNGGAIFELIP